MRWQARFWTVSTFLTLVVLTFALGVPASLRWIVQKFWKVLAGICTVLLVMLVPPLAGSPGIGQARATLLWTTAAVFGLLFAGVFIKISRAAWSNAWQTFLWERTKITDQLDGSEKD